MKINQSISGYKQILLSFIILLGSINGLAQNETSTTLKKKINIKSSADIQLNLYDITVNVRPSVNNEVRIELEYMADGKEEDLDKLKELMESSILKGNSGGSEAVIDLAFQNNFNLEIMGMKWSKVSLKSDKKQSIKLKEFKIKRCDIWLPEKSNIDVDAKYSKLEVKGNIEGNLRLNLYDTKSEFNEVSGNVTGDLKYSQLAMASTNNVKLKLYESTLSTKETKSLSLEAKYSKIATGETASIDLNIYEGSFNGNDAQNVNIISKYANLNMRVAKQLYLEGYEGSFMFDDVEDLRVSAKYIEFVASRINSLELLEAYENEIKIQEVNKLKSKDGKYNEFTIGSLGKSLVHSGYEDEIEIESVSSEFQKIEITGKYTEIDMTLANPKAFILSGKLQYPDLNISEGKYVIRKKIKDDNNLEFNYEYGNVNDSSPQIVVNGYEMAVSINQ